MAFRFSLKMSAGGAERGGEEGGSRSAEDRGMIVDMCCDCERGGDTPGELQEQATVLLLLPPRTCTDSQLREKVGKCTRRSAGE